MDLRYERVKEKLTTLSQNTDIPVQTDSNEEDAKKRPFWQRFIRRLLINAIRVAFVVLFLKFISGYVPIGF